MFKEILTDTWIITIGSGLAVGLILYYVFGIGKKTSRSKSNLDVKFNKKTKAGRDIIIGNKVKVVNKQNDAPKIILDPQKIKKQQTSLREVSDLETGKSFNSLPDGIYGFVYGHAMKRWFEAKDKYPNPNFNLSLGDDNQYMFEVQKINDGLFLIGYAGEEGCASINEDRESFLTISALPRGIFQKVVTVPMVTTKYLKEVQREKRESSGVVSFSTIELKSSKIFLCGVRHINKNSGDRDAFDESN